MDQFQNLNSTALEARQRNFYIFALWHPRTRVVLLFIVEPPLYRQVLVGVISPNPDHFVVVG